MHYKRVVVKVGTKVLSDTCGGLDAAVLKQLVAQISGLRKQGVEVVLVSSGAVGAGRGVLTLKGVEKLAEKQVYAAVGQVKLMATYAELFGKHGLVCAQVLATKEDFRDRTHYLNMRGCFENLLAGGVVPVVNENDVVATTELLFTDNDELAGMVASQLNADAVVILSSIEGFMAGKLGSREARVVARIDLADAAGLKRYISTEKTDAGRGGMLTKFNIAKKLTLQGIAVHLANGKRKDVLRDVLGGKEVGTLFVAKRKANALKRRIAYSEGLAKGAVTVNACAEELLVAKDRIMSLLPVGVIKVDGEFAKGEVIEIMGEARRKLGFGIAEYGAEKVREVMGSKGARAVIHYNHMFIDA